METFIVELIDFLVMLCVFAGVVVGACTVVYIIFEKREKRFGRIFDMWIEKGNRILVTGNLIFIPYFYIPRNEGLPSGGIGVCCINDKDFYQFNLVGSAIGQIIVKKEISPKIMEYGIFTSITKEKFFSELTMYDCNVDDKINDNGASFIFSFDCADMDKLPDWLVSELVAKKLEES